MIFLNKTRVLVGIVVIFKARWRIVIATFFHSKKSLLSSLNQQHPKRLNKDLLK